MYGGGSKRQSQQLVSIAAQMLEWGVHDMAVVPPMWDKTSDLRSSQRKLALFYIGDSTTISRTCRPNLQVAIQEDCQETGREMEPCPPAQTSPVAGCLKLKIIEETRRRAVINLNSNAHFQLEEYIRSFFLYVLRSNGGF